MAHIDGGDSLGSSPGTSSGAHPGEPSQQEYVALLFNRYSNALLRYLSRSMSPDDAAELVQETYVRILRHGHMVQFDAMARSFLFQTAVNLARDQYRRQRVRRMDECLPMNEDTSGGGDSDPLEYLDAEQIGKALERALAKLPRETRLVLKLGRLRGMSYQDIARCMNISTRTVARKMAEATEKLRSVAEALQ
jgi:RNA polymerase sigma-70 factor (ECF subfamily)